MDFSKILAADFSEVLLNRFVSYARLNTASDEALAESGAMPSTESQRDFARSLAEELKKIGVPDVFLTEKSYVIAKIPATKGLEGAAKIGFCAHLDTCGDVSSQDVSPRIFRNFDGKKIVLNGVEIDGADLKSHAGDTVVTSDGRTLLGADDKAGVAEIVTAFESILKSGAPHGALTALFSPDEETGHGMDGVPLADLGADVFYTLDGGAAGEIEAACFNAFKVQADFFGVPKHTGTARPDFVNAVSLAADFVASLPARESPETTDGLQGFYAPMSISGNIEKASATIFLRDFSSAGMKRRLNFVGDLAAVVCAKNPGAKVEVRKTKQYENMAKGLKKFPKAVSILKKAVRDSGVEPSLLAIRGGTDGSRLTELGVPCPNIWTGGRNFHSRIEWASLSDMVLACKTVIRLVELWRREKSAGKMPR